MTGIAVRNFERAQPDTVSALGEAGVATVHEAQGRRGLMHPRMRPAFAGARAAGSAVTALCEPGDNLMLHVAIELLRPGDLLVVAMTSECTDGLFGDLLALALRKRGARGIVIDAGLRDVAELTKMGFPAWSRAISAQGTVKETVGAVNVPVVCAGVLVHPGDVVVADDDGVVVVPRQRAGDVAAAARQRIDKEAVIAQRLEAGESTLDILGLRERLAERGLRYVDEPSGEDS